MQKTQLKKQIQTYFEIHNKEFPEGKEAINELIKFSKYMITENSDLQTLVNEAVKRSEERNRRKPLISEVWQHYKTGIKKVVDFSLQMDIKADPFQYFFICKTPHADNDYTYNCNNAQCKCNDNFLNHE